MRFVLLPALAVLLLALAYPALASTRISASPRTMVLVDDNALKSTHSNFFDDLVSNGHSLSFVNVKEEMVDLKEYDRWLVDNLIIFAPTAEDLGTRTRIQDISDFVDNGGSLLLVSSSTLSEPLRALANHFGVDYDEDNTLLTDAASVLPTPATVSGALTSPVIGVAVSADAGSRAITGLAAGGSAKLAYSGLGAMVTPRSQFVKAAVPANPTTVSGDLAGADVTLVAAFQSLTGARAVFTGSLEMFSNALYALPGADNARLGRALARWAVHDAGHVRVATATHRVVAGAAADEVNPRTHRVKDDVNFLVQLEEYDGAARAWKPFESDRVLFELTLIDPFIRQQFPRVDALPGSYSLTTKLPDSFGVYKWRTSLNQFRGAGAGYTYIAHEVTVPVRPFAHNEYPRYLVVAYPYYASAFAVMAAFTLFCAVFLYTKDTPLKGAAAVAAATAVAKPAKKAE
jgi:oligosaccharyltransferase complex subunit beta